MLDTILPLVRKPIRYTGGEYNITVKADPTVRVGIVFPEVYEIGMSNVGVRIIYHLFNQIPGVQCERVFAPWSDFGEQLMSNGIPLYGLETQRPVRDYDLLGFSLQSELCYTTVLYLLDVGQIPFRASARDGSHPIIIAGGPAVLNPTPMSPVFDAFVIGDGEEVIPQISQILKCVPRHNKDERLTAISKIAGVWVPQLHAETVTVKKQTVPTLSEDAIPSPPLLPTCAITHDRLTIEAMRGCTWGCRFCQAGYTNRPLRVRPAEDIIKAVERGIRQTGYEEVSLLSFSILDYPHLLNLIRRLNVILKKKMANISLPAMRGEYFSKDLGVLLKEIKKTGLTFAPETASEELRRRLNKQFSNESLVNSIRTAYELGWKQVKLYFMIGLPFETEDDIVEIEKLIRDILGAYPKGGLKLAINPFVPKPHTPFEAVPFAGVADLNEKISIIKRMKRHRVEIKYQSPEISYIEAILSRADARAFSAIEQVYKQGGKFEEWREGFDFSRWQRAFDRANIDPGVYLQPQEHYPWDFVDTGVDKDFLKREYARAGAAQSTENCYYGNCTGCGACDGTHIKYEDTEEQYVAYGRYPRRTARSSLYRVRYAIGEAFRYASHLDITRAIYRALRRSDLPIQFTQGFSPIPKVSFCPPKSVGQIAKDEFFDFRLENEYFGNIAAELNARLHSAIRILEVREIPQDTIALADAVNLIYYEVAIPRDAIRQSVDAQGRAPISIQTKSGRKSIHESLESVSCVDGTLTCGLYFGGGKLTIYEFLSYLTGQPVERCKMYKVTRTALCYKKGGVAYSLMEVT